MPYITKETRKIYDGHIKGLLVLLEGWHNADGYLNYIITQLIQGYFHTKDDPSYMTFERIEGLLGLIQKEFFERKTKVYEKKKRKENGDVFE